MSAASDLFERLVGFKSSPTPESDFLEFCRNELSSLEQYHFDYKEKRDRRTATLEDSDQKNLAKAVSGFANSAGGVLIWGIEDGNLADKPISGVEKFARNLSSLASQVTDPVVQEIRTDFLRSDTDVDSGYVFIFVQESQVTPHRVTLKNSDVKDHYFIRSSESFHIASHSYLEDMFGRRPKPNLEVFTETTKEFGSLENDSYKIMIGLKNFGKGIAKSPFLSIKISSSFRESRYGVDGNGNFGLSQIKQFIIADKDGLITYKYGSNQDFVIHSGCSFEVTSIRIDVNRNSQIPVEPIVISYQLIAEGMRLKNGSVSIDLVRIQETP